MLLNFDGLLLLVVVLWLLDAKRLIEPIIIHRQPHFLHPLHDVEHGLRLRLVLVGIDELTTLHVETKVLEDGLHVIVEDVEQEITVISVHVILFLLVNRSKGLRASVLCVGGEGIAQHTDGNLAVPIFRKVLVEVGRASLVSCLYQLHLTLIWMDIDGIATLVSCIGNDFLASVLITCIIGIFTDWHTKDVAELRPVAHVATLVEHGRKKFRKDAKSTLSADKQDVVELIYVDATLVALVLQELVENRIIVFAVNEVVSNVPIIIQVELNEGEAIELRHDKIPSQLFEPWRAKLTANILIGLAVSLELNGNLSDTTKSLVEHT